MKHCFFILSFYFIFLGSSHAAKLWDDAPNFKLEKIGGGVESLKNLTFGGSIVVLNFFDTNCKPCIKELPNFKKLYQKYIKEKNVKIRMISLDSEKEIVKSFIKKYNLNIPVLCDPNGWKAGINYGVVRAARAEIPQIFVIGKKGRIRKHIKGYKENIDKILGDTIEFLKNEEIKEEKANEITIIYTNSANGYLESCDCPENPFGGLVRRITAIKNLKKEYPDAILIDSGDNFPARENKILAEYVLKMMDIINYDAVAIGDQEFILGVEYLEKNIKKLPFISANIVRCDEKMCWNLTDGYKIKEVSGVRVAIISIINPDIFVLFPKDKVKGVEIRNATQTIKGLVSDLKKRSDILILISHSGDEEDKKIANSISGIDLIVGGHSQTLHKEPVKIKNTLIVQTGKDGHRVGRLTLKLDKDKKIKSYEHSLILLTKDTPDDKKGRILIKEYIDKIKKKANKILITK